MAGIVELVKKMENLDPLLRGILYEILEEVERQGEEARKFYVAREEFEDLKRVVRDLAERVRELTEAVKELAEAQRRTEEEVRKLSQGLRRTREEVGGLSRTMAYALENEAYRYLPAFLEDKYGFRIEDRFVRTFVDDEEINFLARARVNGEEVYLVGETVLRLINTAKFKQLRRKVKVVEERKGRRVIPFFVTHFAHPRVLEKAKEAGIIVVQSFEWV